MKYKLFLLVFFFKAVFCLGQTVPEPKITSPNVASMERFDNIPVSFYTGVPSISIPVYEYKKGNISIPIALSYHPGNVRVAQFAGWVGTGWNLSAEGCITRRVKDSPDEWQWAEFMSYYPTQAGVMSGSEKLAATDLTNPTKLNDFYSSLNNTYYDVYADEFSFNVCGYSGKFYYDGSSKSWKVISDQQPIKVDLLQSSFLSKDILYDVLRKYNITLMTLSTRMPELIFAGFVVTLPNGTKCYFGGEDAIDFSSSFEVSGDNFSMTASAWHLNKIIDVNGNEVDFNYKRSFPTYQLGMSASEMSNLGTGPTGGGSLTLCGGTGGVSNVTVSDYNLGGNFEYPVYLTSVSSAADSVIFNSSPSVCQKLTQQIYNIFHVPNNASQNTAAYTIMGDNYHHSDPNIQWEQLDSITVKTSNSIRNKFKFGFSNSLSQRLTLNSFQVLDINNGNLKNYAFDYNNIQKLPASIGDSTDHWGFCNNNTVVGKLLSGIYPYRETNPDVVTTGLLTKITYPTGGYSTYTWEAHDYSRVVAKTKDSVTSAMGFAGGNRIKEIDEYDANNKKLLGKVYKYKKNYYAGCNENLLASSGTLNGLPVYYMSINDRPSYHAPFSYSLYKGELNSLGCYSDAGDMSYIGYDEVVEIDQDGSYTKHFFTCYDQDLFGNKHFDTAPIGYATWRKGDDTYFPMNSTALERGKPTGTFNYSANNVLLQKELVQYRNDAGRFDNYIPSIDYRGSIQCSGYDAVSFITANKEYFYSYYPVQKQVFTYDQTGNNPAIQTELYNYNGYNQLTNQTTVNSKGDSIATFLKYPQDYSDAVYQTMVSKNIISPVIEQTTTKGHGTELSKTQTSYAFWNNNGLILPDSIKKSVLGNIPETEIVFSNYDSSGNPLEYTTKDGITTAILWGYNHQYPVAKIVGSYYSTASNTINQSILDNPTDEQALRNELGKLRTISNAHVSTYTYMPLVGMTSGTDPNGRTNYYEYDGMSRLRLIRDQDNNVIKTFCYNFAGQPEACSISYTSTQSQSFKKNCGSCSTGSSFVYTATATSSISQSDAIAKALADIAANGQHYADSIGSCTLNNSPSALNTNNQVSLNGFSLSTSNNVLTMSLNFYPTIDLTPGAPFEVGRLSNSCYSSFSGCALVYSNGVPLQLICDRGQVLIQATSQTLSAYSTINITNAVIQQGGNCR